jgi:hypothetical protein
MYARVSTFEGPVADVDAEVEFARSTLLPAARKLPGWQGCVDLVDPITGKELLVTFWDTEEHLRESEARAGQIRGQGAEQSGREAVAVERYTVALSEISTPRPARPPKSVQADGGRG